MKARLIKLKQVVAPAKLMVVTKKRSADEIYEAVQSGAEYLGENRVQELVAKYSPGLMEAISLAGAEIHSSNGDARRPFGHGQDDDFS
ncbi:MAG: hypothetical protein AAB383_00770 [Patescibacteria group bacterium]